jgi:hypothetical protein
MTTLLKRVSYLAAGAASGGVWFGVATLLDSDWAISKDTWPFIAALCAAVLTGILISTVFRPLFRRTPGGIFVFLPLFTLPMGIVLFSLLLWLARRFTGVHFVPSVMPAHELRLIAETYLIGGLISIFAPVLFGLALLNQYAMRFLLRRLA